MANLLEIIQRTMAAQNYSYRSIKAYLSVAKELYHFLNKPIGCAKNAGKDQVLSKTPFSSGGSFEFFVRD